MRQNHPSVADRHRLWNIALKLNRRAKRRGQERPFTPYGLLLLRWLLWDAPRREGIWPSEAAIAERLGCCEETVARCKKRLAAWKLIVVAPRWRAEPWPVRVGRRLHFIRKGMRTSDAITFPNLRSQFPARHERETRPRHFAGEERSRFAGKTPRDAGGRWLGAAARRRLAAIEAEWTEQVAGALARAAGPAVGVAP